MVTISANVVSPLNSCAFNQKVTILFCMPLAGNSDYNVTTVFTSSLRYMAIVKYKTASYSFYLPVAVVMYMVSG